MCSGRPGCFWLNKQWQTKREGSPVAENSGVRTRTAGLSIHFSALPYLQHMNYRFPHASRQEVDAVFTSQWCLQTNVSRVEDNLIMLKACHLCEYVLLAYRASMLITADVMGKWASHGLEDTAISNNIGLHDSPV